MTRPQIAGLIVGGLSMSTLAALVWAVGPATTAALLLACGAGAGMTAALALMGDGWL